MWESIRTEGFWEGEVWNKRKQGSTYLQRLTITCVKNQSGDTTHYVGDGQDITDAKQAAANREAINAARKVQQSLFPSEPPSVPGFDIAGAVHPARDASGDYFDFISLGDGSIGFLVADVSSHGLGPALLMAQMQAYIRALVDAHDDPAVLLNHAGRLFALNSSEHFVTFFLGRCDIESCSLVYASAGHQGYVVCQNGDVKVLESTGIPLGIDEKLSVASAPAVALKSGDIILLPTDGIEETKSPDGSFFGRERAFDVVRANRESSAAEIVEALFGAAREFTDGEPQEDDITAVVVKILPTPTQATPRC
jgi:sigma-B regulation protein RsbU (phosphoserine phosphatase)